MISIPKDLVSVFESPHTKESLIKDSSLQVQVRPESGDSDAVLCLGRATVDTKMKALHLALQECGRKEEIKEVSMYVPADMVAVIIGKRGRQIARFQDQTHTSISIQDRSIPRMSERLITIAGPPRNIEEAVELIHTTIIGHRCYEKKREGLLLKVQVKPEETEECKDWVSARPDMVAVAEGQIVIQGQVKDCISSITSLFEVLDQSKINGSARARESIISIKPSRRSEHYPDKLRNLKRQLIEVELFYSLEGSDEVKITMRGSLADRQNAFRAVLEAIEHHSRSSSIDIRESRYSRSNAYAGRSRSPDRSVLHILVPQEYIGRLIGKGGANVKVLKEFSGCQINFQPHSLHKLRTPDGREAKVCTLSGTTKTVAAGVRAIHEQVEKFQSGS